MKFYFFIILLFIPVFINAQSEKIDSLNIELNKRSDPAERVDILLKISRLYVRINQDSSFIYSRKALEISEMINDTISIALSKKRLAKVYCFSGKYALAETMLIESAKMFKYMQDSLKYAMALSDLGEVQKYIGNFDKAIKFYLEAGTILQKLKNKESEAIILNKIGSLYCSINQYDKAIEYYNYALDIVITQDYKPAISALYINIGNVYSDKSETVSQQNEKTKLLKLSESFYLKALPIKREINDIKGLGSCLVNLGLSNNRMDNYKIAEDYLKEAVETCKHSNNLTDLYLAYHNLAINYSDSKNYSSALKYAEMVLLAKENDQFELGVRLKSNNHSLLARIYRELNMNDKAIIHYGKYNKLKDSIFNMDLIKTVNELEVKYQTELKDQQNQLLLKENDIQKLQIQKSNTSIYILFITLLLTLLSIIIILLYIRQRRFNTLQKTILLEQRLLRSQMNPHFIFNSLTAIQSFILQSKPSEGAKYLSKFATLIRLVLDHSRIEYVPIGKEIESLRYYLDLQKLRYENQFEYEIRLDESIQIDNCLIPPMLAQPFIENAIEHGIAPSKKEGFINVSFQIKEDKMIEFRVEDNGVGISKTKINRNKESHHSLASQITKERLILLNRNKKKKISLEIKEKTDNHNVEGVITLFLIPYIVNY